jgi:hypothetical protein
MLSIDLVRRPSNSDREFKFCSQILPAAIADFLNRKAKIPLSVIQRISVGNVAEPALAGCKCYVGIMVRMGFNIVNRSEVDNIHSFCESNGSFYREIIFAGASEESNKRIPEVSPIGTLFIALARSYTRLERKIDDI